MRPARLILCLVVLALTTAVPGTVAQAQGAGYWHTSGNKIQDAKNATVRIAGINWYGFETSTAVPGGLTTADYRAILGTVKAQGYNTVRLPFSNQMIESPTPGSALNLSFWHGFGAINTDLQGLDSLGVMDRIVAAAGSIGLKVILDNHRSEAGSSAEANGLWYTASYPESAWIADWTMLANRYLGNSTVIGFDLRNEPHNANGGGSCWDCGGAANDWHLAAERAGNAVLAVNPQLLIFVEGTDVYNNDYYWWGGNLEGVAHSPVTLAVANQLVYSAHDYGPHEYGQQWFNGNTSAASLDALWTQHWGFISQAGIAPVWLGEFGTTDSDSDVSNSAPGSQGQWFSSMVSFLASNPAISWTYWALNGEDSYGLLDAYYDITPANAAKQAALASIQFALSLGAPPAATPPAAPTGLTASSVSSSQINLGWAASAGAGIGYTISFGTSPSALTTTLASGVGGTTYPAINLNPAVTYYFQVFATNAAGSSTGSNIASATTQATALPTAPTALSAAPVSSSQIALSWTASVTPGVTYTIYSGNSPSAIVNVIASGISGTTYQASGLQAATTHYYVVTANSAAGSSPGSNATVATTQAPAAPAAPSGLSASPTSASQINLQWQASSTAGVSYTIYEGTLPGLTLAVLATGLSNTNYSVGGLADGTTYYFAVKAVSTTGVSAASNQASATTQTAPSTPPAGLAASAVSATQINLAWNPVPNTGATYNVYVGTNSGATNTQIASGLSSTNYAVTGLNPSTTYFFTVRSVSGGGTSSPSTQASETTLSLIIPVTPPTLPVTPTPPAAPSGLTATAVSAGQINLTWTPSSTAGATYNVFGGEAGSASNLLASGLGGTNYSVTGLSSDSTYTFTVVAVNAGANSSPSAPASATTQTAPRPAVPTTLSAAASSSSQVNLSWSGSTTPGVTYNIYSGTASGLASTLVSSGSSATAYSVTGLGPETTYFFTVKSVLGSVSSPSSNEASAKTLAAATGACHVAYTDLTDWGFGFTAGISITNTSGTPINAWTLTWSYAGNQKIYQSWSSNYSQSGSAVTLANAPWNGTIAPNGSITGVGFNANYSGANVVPTSFSLNGVACR